MRKTIAQGINPSLNTVQPPAQHSSLMSIKQALISVSDKIGIVEFARELSPPRRRHSLHRRHRQTAEGCGPVRDRSQRLYRLSGNARWARQNPASENTRGNPGATRPPGAHGDAWKSAAIPTIDLVVVNLYPFTQTVARPDCTFEEAIENIDIGGPAMVRAAAKNYKSVTVVTDPADYAPLLREIKSSGGTVSPELRFRLACKAFSHTASYDSAISNYLTSLEGEGGERRVFPQRLNLNFKIAQDLRYGENPHQQAAFYREPVPAPGSLASYVQLQGKELSYNNIADADAAWECVKTFELAGLRHRQACQSLRRGDRPIRRSAHTSAPLPPIPPPPSAASSHSTAARWCDSRGGEQAVRRSDHRPATHHRGPADTRSQNERAGSDRAVPDGQQYLRLQARRRRDCWCRRRIRLTSPARN